MEVSGVFHEVAEGLRLLVTQIDALRTYKVNLHLVTVVYIQHIGHVNHQSLIYPNQFHQLSSQLSSGEKHATVSIKARSCHKKIVANAAFY